MSLTITKPEPLDPTVYYTRDQFQAWQASMTDYYDAVRAEEVRQREAQEQEENVCGTGDWFNHCACVAGAFSLLARLRHPEPPGNPCQA